METSIYKRVTELLRYKNISVNALSKLLEMPQTTVNNYIKGSRTISFELIEGLSKLYPDINERWLLTGEGSMLNVSSENVPNAQKTIRYWVDIDATGGGIELFEDSDTKRFIDISIPEFKDCTDAVNLYGDSMAPLYKNGQIIILKKWTEHFIDYGNAYLIITREGNRMVKYIRQGSDEAHVLCVSENKDFDPFEIEKADILQLYVVKGAIQKNTM